jgi:hypothetical protein
MSTDYSRHPIAEINVLPVYGRHLERAASAVVGRVISGTGVVENL